MKTYLNDVMIGEGDSYYKKVLNILLIQIKNKVWKID